MLGSPEKKQLQAAIKDAEGWTKCKTTISNNNNTNIEEAIKDFKYALCLDPNPRTYLHLAMAYELKLQNPVDQNRDGEGTNNVKDIKRKILAFCQHAQDMDTYGEYSDEIEALKQRIHGLKEEKPKSEEETPKATVSCQIEGTAKGTLFWKEQKEANSSDGKNKTSTTTSQSGSST